MICKKCGNPVNKHDRFCAKCGSAMEAPVKEIKTLIIDGVKMSAMDMVDYCIQNKYIVVGSFMSNQTKKERSIFFENIINEMQDDETAILCFAGNHDYKGGINTSGMHSYVLTNKRLMIAGWYGKKSGMTNPLKAYSNIYKATLAKNPKCDKDSVYVRDITHTDADMVGGHDVITFHTTKSDFHVMFYSHNVTHQLCTKINAALKELKEHKPE